MIKMIIGVLVAIFLLLQFYNPFYVEPNPKILAEPNWDSSTTQQLFNRACADCHSHQTRWPWYSKIAPLSWLIYYDVKEGREHFNVSLWGIQKKNEGDEAAEEVEEGEMPPAIYLITHPEAKLTAGEKNQLIRGLKATFGTD